MQDIYKDTTLHMDQAVDHTRMELAKVRTGRANPDLLNSILVNPYFFKYLYFLYSIQNLNVF